MKNFKASIWLSCILTMLIILLTGIASTHAATINVTANAPDVLNGANASCSLREAITNINNGATTYADCVNTGAAYGTSDTINIPSGTYTTTIVGRDEDSNATGDYDINRNVAIVGAGSSTTIIDGGGLDRVFHIIGGFTVAISGITITGGTLTDASGGGGGGGINNRGGVLTVTNSTITGNTVTERTGGGIYSGNNGTLTVTNSTISNNSAPANYGGGIGNYGTLTVTNSTISGNMAAASEGGGISNVGTLTVTNSTISGNSANYSGGIYNGGTATVTNSTVSGNTATWDGGGIRNGNTLTIANTTISGNSATNGYGGGIYSWNTLDVTNTTITGNSATNGGGIYRNVGTVTLSNTIVANQTSGGDCFGTVVSTGYNLESASSCLFTSVGDLKNTNPLLGALASNGGPTQTMALQSGSPAIDAGDCAGGTVTTDQRGTARPQGSACDIGAFEYVAPATAVSVPTMTEYGMIIFTLLAGLGSIYYLRRRRA